MLYREFPGLFPASLDQAAWQQRAQDIRARSEALLGPFPTQRCPLQARLLGEESGPGYRRLHVEYYSEPEDTVRAYVLVPDSRPGRLPAVIAIHTSAGSGKESVAGLRGLRHPASPAVQDRLEDRYITARDEPQRKPEMACLVAPRPLFIGVCSKDLAGPTCQHLGTIELGR
jgi:hypothetical protein